MNKLTMLTALLLVSGMIVVSPAFANQMNSSNQNPGVSDQNSAAGSHQLNYSNENAATKNLNRMNMAANQSDFRVKDLLGKNVKNKQGEDFGEVKDVLIGQDGNAQFVVLSEGGGILSSSKYIPIPFETFMTNANIQRLATDKDLVVSFDKNKIDSAPSFSNDNFDLNKKDWQHKSECYFGVTTNQAC